MYFSPYGVLCTERGPGTWARAQEEIMVTASRVIHDAEIDRAGSWSSSAALAVVALRLNRTSDRNDRSGSVPVAKSISTRLAGEGVTP